MKSNHFFFALIAISTLFGHYAINSQSESARLKQIVELSDKAMEIEADTIRDLMYANLRLNENFESEKNSAYVSGVVATLNEPDHYQAIWHKGYDRGTEVQIMVQTSQKEELRTSPVSYIEK